MKNKVYILLDRSGSMQTMWKEALNGINGYGDMTRNIVASGAGFATAMNATTSGTARYFSSGKSAEFYDFEDKKAANI